MIGKLPSDPVALAVEIVRQEGGQFERVKLLLEMVQNLSVDNASQLAEEGIRQAIKNGRLRCIGGDQLAL